MAPLVCVHPVSGRAVDYQLLADALDWPGPVLGLNAPEPGSDAREPGYRLTELASRYCDELDLSTPPLLLGWSIGGGLIRAFFHHVQRPVPVVLHLFESADAHPSHPRPPTLGWDDLAPSIERHEVAGTHFTLLAPHRIEALARTISRHLPR